MSIKLPRVKKNKNKQITKKNIGIEPEIVEKSIEVDVVNPDVEADLISSYPITEGSEFPVIVDDYIDASPHENKKKDVVVYDPLTAYLREMRQYPPLTKDQEIALATRYRKDNDLEAAYQLVSSNLWLVVKIARDYERAAKSVLDLIQEGNIGLMEAVKNFDPLRGVRFPSYAVWWIKAYIIRYLIANWRLVKIGTTQAQRKLFFNLNKEKEKLEREGFKPEPKLLAKALDVKESDIIEMEQRLASPDVSVDAQIGEDSDSNLLNMLPSPNSNAEEVMAAKEQKELIDQYLNDFEKMLTDKEHLIYKERLLSEDKATLQDLSDRLSLTPERIRQIEVKIKEKLRSYLEEKIEDAAIEIM
jgi:RNA polymerase sigma-32 factor